MNKRTKALYAVASMAAASWLPTGAYAQGGQSVAGVIEEVLVTARRREESLQEVPIAISAFGGDDLVQRGVESVQNMNAIAPNLSVMGGGATGESQGSFRIRGLPGVSVYIDGVWQASTDGLLTTSVVEVDRIEVLRGPQGTLFGSSSLGGAIQYVTRAPADTFGARFQGSIGSFDRKDFQAAFDLPLSDTFKTKFTAASQYRDGFVESVVIDRAFGDVNDELYRADFMWTPTDSINVRYNVEDSRTDRNGPARVLKNIGEARVLSGGTFSTYPQAQIYINAFGINFNNQNNVSGFPGGAVGEYKTRIGWENPGLVIDVMRHTLDASWDVNDWLRLRSISGYRDTMRAVQTDFDGAQEVFMLERDFRAKSIQFTEELQILGTHDRFDWVVGGYYSKENNRGRTVSWALPEFTCDLWSNTNANANGLRTTASERAQCRTNRAAALGLPSTASNADMNAANLNGVTMSQFNNATNVNNDAMTYTKVESTAMFADLTWRITDQFTAAAGIRYSKEETGNYRIGASTTGIGGTALQNRATTFPDGSIAGDFFGWRGGELVALPTREFSATTKRLTLQYQWTPDLMTYVGYADGFGPGGQSTVSVAQYGAYPDIPVGTLVFDEQTVENFEVGLRADWFNGRLRTNISAFMTDWANQQTSTYIATRFAGPATNPLLPLSPTNLATQIDRDGNGQPDLFIFPALRTTNINKAEASGIEFEGTWFATDALRINLNFGLLDTKYVDLGPAALGVVPAVTKNSSFAQAPEITGNIAASYEIGFSNGAALTPRIDYTYTDEYVLTTDDIRQSKQEGYGLVNARLTYDSGANWTVALAGSNLTDERYLNSGFITAAEQFDFVTLGRPREWGLTFSLRFE